MVDCGQGGRMSVKINIPLLYRHVTDGLSAAEVEGATVEDCLKSFMQRFPGVKGVLLDKKGRVLNGIEIYLNHKSSYPAELVKPVEDGDEIFITLVLAGG
jgi:molybdopterin converting factor small subunit